MLLTSPSRMVCLYAAAFLELVGFSSYFGMDFQCCCMVSPQGNLHQDTWPGPICPSNPHHPSWMTLSPDTSPHHCHVPSHVARDYMDRNGLCCLNNFDPPCSLPLKSSQPLGRSSYYNGSRSWFQDTGTSHGPCGPTRPSGYPAQPSLLPDTQPGQRGHPGTARGPSM